MSLMTDIRDWVGGWPMEFVKEDELLTFCEQKLHLRLVRLLTGEGNTEVVFSKGHTWLDALLSKRMHRDLPRPFSALGKVGWSSRLQEHSQIADTAADPRRSTLLLWEDGKALSYPHSLPGDIDHYGHGRYRHYCMKVMNKMFQRLLFSTSDNSDPNTNGRKYTYTVDDPALIAELRNGGTQDLSKDPD